MSESGAVRRRGRSSPARLPWPRFRRSEEDRAVEVVARHGWSVAVVGAPGLGKSVVAERVVERVTAADRSGRLRVVVLNPSPHESEIPFAAALDAFGAFDVDASGGPESAARALRDAARVGEHDLLVRIDDADHLDALTARLVAWLVRDEAARVVLTARDFTMLAEPLRDLWRDDLLERIDLGPLGLRATATLLREALGGPLESASVERVHRATEGNPLYLREVVRAAMTSGALEHTASGWYWRGRITASRSLGDMYRTELSRLPDDLRDVVDIVALADPIPLPELLTLVSDGDVDRVTALGFVRVDLASAGGSPIVRPAHPLVGEVVRDLVPVARRTRLYARANAYRAVSPTGALPASRLRATLWALECGITPPPTQLLDAASIAVGLQEYESAIGLAGAALADEFAEAATVVRALVLRATATTFGKGREPSREDAERAWELARTSAGVIDDELVVAACEALANLRQLHDDDLDAALELVGTAAVLVGPTAVERLRVLRLVHLGWGGRFAEVVAETDRAGVIGRSVPPWFLDLASSAVVALGAAGRVPEALRLGAAALETASAHIREYPWSVGEIVSSMHQVQMWAGNVSDVITEVRPDRTNQFFKYDFTLELIAVGNVAIAERRWEDAVVAFRSACERFAVMDHGGFSAYPWVRLSVALVMLGETAEAAETLDRATAIPLRGMRISGEELPASIVVTEHMLGRPVAYEHAVAVAERSLAAGSWLSALFGRMMQLRIEQDTGRDTRATLASIREIAPHVQTPTAEAYLAYLAAVDAGDEAQTRRWRDRLAAFGFRIDTAVEVRQRLTKREYEVAELAATGLSNRQIAEKLGVSVRTVDAHISRVFAKWDVHARAELADLL